MASSASDALEGFSVEGLLKVGLVTAMVVLILPLGLRGLGFGAAGLPGIVKGTAGAAGEIIRLPFRGIGLIRTIRKDALPAE